MKTFAELPYERPDFQAVGKELEALAEKLKNASSYEEMRDLFFKEQELTRGLSTMQNVCSIRSDMNTTDPFYSAERKEIGRASCRERV